jgi:LysR family hydrogen peroxide-inducible transcriptional activator
MRDQVEKLCQMGQNQDSTLNLRAGSLHTLIEVVSTSGGYTLLPTLAQDFFKKTYPDGFRELAEPKPSRKVSLVFHRSFLKRSLIEAIFGLISENLPHRAVPVERKGQTKVIDPAKGRFSV